MNHKLNPFSVSAVAFLAGLMISCPALITSVDIPIEAVEMKFHDKEAAQKAVKAIECAGGGINKTDRKGQTILHYAAKHAKDPEVIMVLLDAGANPSVRDIRGNTPADYARKNKALRATSALQRLR